MLEIDAASSIENAIATPEKPKADADILSGTITAQGLTGGYKKGEPVIHVDQLEVHAGERVGISGPSGCGKSSLLRAFLSLLPWQKGTLSRNGQPLDEMDKQRLFSLIYQDPGRSFNPVMTIREAFDEVVRYRKQAGPDASHVLAQVEMPAEALDRWPHQFSGGQKQRLAIARALLTSPKLLLCDEPFSSLDAALQSSFLTMLANLCHNEDLAVLLVAHDLPRMRDSCDRLVLIDDGRVVWEGRPDELSHSEEPFIKMLLN
jgi:peptide/nickel transport system ATP-binding protein